MNRADSAPRHTPRTASVCPRTGAVSCATQKRMFPRRQLVRHACKLGLEGLVSKRRDSRYRAGRSLDWIKVKNRQHPAMYRVQEALSG
jgi:hypothetical protein